MKKTVNILIIEPKPLLMDLTRKSIQSKPDDQYRLKIVGTAVTAKAGYYELYKHRPHILFLNPELEDEAGLSFITHALERLPYLKIVVMTSRFQDETMYLQGGAHEVAQVPIQKASLWRKLDRLIQEVDKMGLLTLDNPVDEKEESLSLPVENLFQFEENDKPSFNPIFEDLTKSLESEETETDHVEDSGTDSLVVIEEELIHLEESKDTSPTSTKIDDGLIVEDDEVEIIDWENTSSPSDVEEEEDDTVVFNPFQFDTKEETESNTEPEPHEQETSNEDNQVTPIPSASESFSMMDLPLSHSKEPPFKSVILNQTEDPEFLSHFENKEETTSSNEARTSDYLYLSDGEYNKSSTKERRSFEAGFFNREGAFVSLFPPRERFEQFSTTSILTVDPTLSKPSTQTMNPVEEEGIFSSVKKLFKRR